MAAGGVAMTVYVRELTADEHTTIGRLVQAQAAPARLVRRARIIHLARGGAPVAAIARQLGLSRHGVRPWIARFNAAGMAGLDDAPRSGRPPTYQEDERSRVIGALVEAARAEVGAR
jgi:transposase